MDALRRKARPPGPSQVKKRLKDALESGRLRFTSHAIKEMKKDGLTAIDIERVLAGCRVGNPTNRDTKWGSWTYDAHGRTADGTGVAVQVGMPEIDEERISIVTVWRIKQGG